MTYLHKKNWVSTYIQVDEQATTEQNTTAPRGDRSTAATCAFIVPDIPGSLLPVAPQLAILS